MFEWLFGKKKDDSEILRVEADTKQAFSAARDDINNLSKWIKHLDSEDSKQQFRFNDVEERLSTIETDLEGIKNSLAFLEGSFSKGLFKQRQTPRVKQTAVEAVQTHVQTAVQTGGRSIFQSLSLMERALIQILLNSEMKLSYEDLAAMLGKSRATIRGQINSIKQKGEGLVEEIIESNGKKRVFIPQEIREMMLKKEKVRARNRKKED